MKNLFRVFPFGIPASVLAGSLIFQQAPPVEVLSDSSAAYTFAPVPGKTVALDSCALYASDIPAGAQRAGHARLAKFNATVSSSPPVLQLSFQPSDGAPGPQLALGVHYLLAACADSAATSPEFPLRVSTSRSATIVTPSGQETSVRPEISWNPVPGVPAYHLLLSDQPLKIDAAAGTVSGASIIWQAITTGNRIVYGDPDPSGNFSQVAPPPLAPGVEYNLVILNNYDGKSALNTSTKAEALRLFTLQAAPDPLPAPVVLAPARGAAFQAPKDSVLRFRWTGSRTAKQTANTYRLYLYAAETQNGLTVLRPVWQTEGTDTVANLSTRGVLTNGRYVAKVFALADNGSSGVSDTLSFQYQVVTQTLRLGARVVNPDTTRLGNIRVTVTARDGSGLSLPLYTQSDGYLSVDLVLGRYQADFTGDGYDPVSLETTLDGGEAVVLDPVLSLSAGRLSGVVSDTLGQPISQATVTATRSDGISVAAQSDAQGRFLLGIVPGSLRMGFQKDNYLERDTSINLVAGNPIDLGTIRLRRAPALLSGVARTTAGTGLAGADVEIRDTLGTPLRRLLTDAQGGFNLFLPRGDYQVAVSKAGYSAPTQSVHLIDAATVNVTLTPGASVLKVIVTQRTLLAAGGSVSAPLEGADIGLRTLSGIPVANGRSDLNGALSLSVADTGSFWLSASQPGVYSDSQSVRVSQPKSTVEADLELLRYASVSGHIRFQPDTLVDPAHLRVSLLPASGGAAVATVNATQAPSGDTLGGAVFTLDRIPAGNYRVTCGIPGWGPTSEPALAVTKGQRLDTLMLILKPITSRVRFQFQQAGQDLPGTIHLRAPFADQFVTGDKKSMGSGSLVFDAEPADSATLPLRAYAMTLLLASGQDTTVTLAFPARQDPARANVAGGTVSIPYTLDENADSGLLAYSSRAGNWDTLRLSPAKLRIGSDTAQIPTPPQGGVLEYALSLRFQNRIYATAITVPRRVFVPPDSGLADLRLAEGDSVSLPAGGHGQVTVRAFDAAGDPLDPALMRGATVAFQVSPGSSVTIESTQGFTAVLRAGEQATAKTGSTRAAPLSAQNLTVTVTYAGRSKSLSVPVRVVSLRVHRLELVSLLGDNPWLSSPQNVPLRVTGYDTSTVPPTALTVRPEFVLDPPEAGNVAEGVLHLDTAFLGSVRVLARYARGDGTWLQTELFPQRDSLLRGLNVGQTLAAPSTRHRFFYNWGVEVQCPDSAFPKGGQLRLWTHSMPRTFASLRKASLEGPAYELSNPLGAALGKPMEVRLSPPPGGNSAAFLQRYDAARLAWFDLADTGSGNPNGFGLPYLSAQTEGLDGQYYGLFTASQPLGLSTFEVIPNPFSPRVTALRDGNAQPGARIRLRPESDSSAEVTLTLIVYASNREPVRTLVNYQTYPKSEVEVYWDGLDNRGRRVRNGRYLLVATLTPTGGGRSRSLVRPVVVFE